jgi:tRNA-specific 2-thiouridylase
MIRFTILNPQIYQLKKELKVVAAPLLYTPQMGKVVGNIKRAHYFTTGQRKGLNVGGTTDPCLLSLPMLIRIRFIRD